jgi:hypothetical protein
MQLMLNTVMMTPLRIISVRLTRPVAAIQAMRPEAAGSE